MNPSQNQTPSQESERQNSTLSIVESSTTLNHHDFKVIQEIELCYRQGTLLYAESVQKYTQEIENIKHQINMHTLANKAEEEVVVLLLNELRYEDRILEKLNEKFSQLIHSIEELQIEYKGIVEESEYSKILTRKQRDLMDILHEIETSEEVYLGKELAHLNTVASLKPKQKIIKNLEESLQRIELEKAHFQDTQLHQLPQLYLNQKKETEPVEVDAIDASIERQ